MNRYSVDTKEKIITLSAYHYKIVEDNILVFYSTLGEIAIFKEWNHCIMEESNIKEKNE